MDTRSITGLPHNVGAQFQAKFDGRCPVCTLAVYEGDLMGYVDDTAVCDGCYNEADQENWQATRANVREQMEADRAKDPEAYDRRQLAIKRMLTAEPQPNVCPKCHLVRPCDCEPTAAEEYSAMVRKQAEQHPGREWVPTPPGSTPGFIHVTPHLETEPPKEDDMTTQTVEPGIQALMAAGLLQGQEPGGSGVCPAEIISADGKVTEVAIPVPVTAAPAEEVPSPGSGGDAAADALARRRERAAQLEANAAALNIQEVMEPPAPAPDPGALQASLQAAVDAGTMAPEVAATLGWVAPLQEPEPAPADPLQASLTAAVAAGTMTAEAAEALGWVYSPSAHLIGQVTAADVPGAIAAGVQQAESAVPAQFQTPRTQEPVAEFMADPSSNPAASLFLDALAAAKSGPEEDAIIQSLDNLPAYEGHDGPFKEVQDVITGIIVDAIENHPRSQQVKIGPSEVGTECDHCLAAKLAGWQEVRSGEAWLPTVGTAVHSWLEAVFARLYPRYLAERKVLVGEIDGVPIYGSCDLLDVVRGITVDWKIVGPTTLKAAKLGASHVYRVQQNLYARGWNMLGVKVTRVAIGYLPRNAVSLKQSVWWSEPYNEQVALDALERASGFAAVIRQLREVGTEEQVTAYISGLPRLREVLQPVNGVETKVRANSVDPAAPILCLDCARYEDYPADPKAALKQLDGLL